MMKFELLMTPYLIFSNELDRFVSCRRRGIGGASS